ncbi:hypothetical protein ABT034_32210 [Streptomyces sp. NPDC002773]
MELAQRLELVGAGRDPLRLAYGGLAYGGLAYGGLAVGGGRGFGGELRPG